MQQVVQQLQHTNQLLTQMQNCVLTLEQERARRVSIATDTVDEPRNFGFGLGHNTPISSHGSSLVDTRSLGKPEVFKGDDGSFADWHDCSNPLYINYSYKRGKFVILPLYQPSSPPCIWGVGATLIGHSSSKVMLDVLPRSIFQCWKDVNKVGYQW